MAKTLVAIMATWIVFFGGPHVHGHHHATGWTFGGSGVAQGAPGGPFTIPPFNPPVFGGS